MSHRTILFSYLVRCRRRACCGSFQRVPLALCIASPAAAGRAAPSADAEHAARVGVAAAARVSAHLAAVQPPLGAACALAVLLAFQLSDHDRRLGCLCPPPPLSQPRAGQPVGWTLRGLLGWVFGDDDLEEEQEEQEDDDDDEGGAALARGHLFEDDGEGDDLWFGGGGGAHRAAGCGFHAAYIDCLPPLESLRLLPCWPDAALAGALSALSSARAE